MDKIDNETYGIVLDDSIKKEFEKFGSKYLLEARRIKDKMPLFPSKF